MGLIWWDYPFKNNSSHLVSSGNKERIVALPCGGGEGLLVPEAGGAGEEGSERVPGAAGQQAHLPAPRHRHPLPAPAEPQPAHVAAGRDVVRLRQPVKSLQLPRLSILFKLVRKVFY